jgi:hypothetical protein
MMLKDAGLVPEDKEEAAKKAAEAELERNKRLRKQASLILRAKPVEDVTREHGGSSSEDDTSSEDERQQLNGAHHSLFGSTG